METITLRLFFTFMLTTAALAVFGVWFESVLPESYFKTVATCFIIGLANFLLWAPQVIYQFLSALRET